MLKTTTTEITITNTGKIDKGQKIKDPFVLLGNVYDPSTRKPMSGFKIDLQRPSGIIKKVHGSAGTAENKGFVYVARGETKKAKVIITYPDNVYGDYLIRYYVCPVIKETGEMLYDHGGEKIVNIKVGASLLENIHKHKQTIQELLSHMKKRNNATVSIFWDYKNVKSDLDQIKEIIEAKIRLISASKSKSVYDKFIRESKGFRQWYRLLLLLCQAKAENNPTLIRNYKVITYGKLADALLPLNKGLDDILNVENKGWALAA